MFFSGRTMLVALALTCTSALQTSPRLSTMRRVSTATRHTPSFLGNRVEGVLLAAPNKAAREAEVREGQSFEDEVAEQTQLRAASRQAQTALLDNVALINGGVIALALAAAAYELLHVDVDAIIALYQYGLGRPYPDVQYDPGVTQLAVSIDLLMRLPADSLHAYEAQFPAALVPTNPVYYKACTSGVAYTLGDFVSQIYQGRNLTTVDLARSARSGAAGFIGHGPLCHYWMVFMETYLDFGGAWYGTGVKVLADQTVWSLYLNAMYSFLIGTLALRNPRDVWADVKSTSWPALRSSWRFWPFVHTISFSHAVPLDLKLLWVDMMEIVWVTILSKVANDDKESKLAENPEAETLDVVEAFGVDPTLEIELTREAELAPVCDGDACAPAPLAFELPQKVLGACWPLIAMWPVIYGTNLLEKSLGLEV